MELGHQMRRNHNPRYAPESLERKLSPSGLTGIPVAAELYVPNTKFGGGASQVPAVWLISANVRDTSGTVSALSAVKSPPDGSGDPPIDDPIIPIGPAGPA